jgi:uncharacterized protein (DUF2252 family)
MSELGYAAEQERKPKPVPHLTMAERAARGKAARAGVPRSSHAEIDFPQSRDPIAFLEGQAATRVPELVPIRYGRMLASSFAFYRGGALIMASDLARTPSSGLRTQLCGDAHLSNFGVYASPERNMVFSLNDFDETAPGPWEWDVKRLVASFAIAGRELGYSKKERQAIVHATARSYRESMNAFAGMQNLQLWYARLDVEQIVRDYSGAVDPGVARRAEANIAKARTRDSMHAFEKLTHVVDGERRIISDPPLIVPLSELVPPGTTREALEGEFRELLRSYRRTLASDRRHLLEQFRFVEIARKVVGVGSVGTRAWIVLMLGVDDEDPLFLQAKEAQPSVLERFVGKSGYTNCGQRVVAGQRLMQSASDIFLGWQHTRSGLDGEERDFYVRQLRDWKGSAVIEAMIPKGMTVYGRVCAWTLARAHARAGDRIAIASYLGRSDVFDRAMAAFAEAYADQNERDYRALKEAVESGRIEAQPGL